MVRKLIHWFCGLLVIIGCIMILYPNIDYLLSSYQYHQIIDDIEKEREVQKNDTKENDLLYQDMKKYNEQIYQNGQVDLKDAWSYEQPSFKLLDYGVVEDAIGYLSIESINVKLPLYLGANKTNLSKGATVLGQTSMPIGGENSNCVIAAHRKMKKHPMLSDIEKVQIGDEVLVDNLWETLHYQVVEIRVIKPNETDAIKIQDGKDMITIITCHPYPYNYQRYVLYCQRNDGNLEIPKDLNTTTNNQDITYSQESIDKENLLNILALCLVLIIIVVFVGRKIYLFRSKRKKLVK